MASSSLQGGQATNGHQQEGYRSQCRRCGAVRIDKQIGLESSIAAYLDQLRLVFAEVWRVLHPLGTLWLELGDSYSGSWGNYSGQNRGKGTQRAIVTGSRVPNPAYDGLESYRPTTSLPQPGLKPKDLCGIPWTVAFMLQEMGWYLRQEITWAKKAPMPESVQDRFTSATEKIFLLAKSERYFFDAEAVKEPAGQQFRPSFRGGAYINNATFHNGQGGLSTDTGNIRRQQASRNMRNFWLLGPEPYREAHFATFPPEIPRRCILAGCPPGGIVLDPFGGAGTVGLVASQLGRHAVLLDLSLPYCQMARDRIRNNAPLLHWAETQQTAAQAVQPGLYDEETT